MMAVRLQTEDRPSATDTSLLEAGGGRLFYFSRTVFSCNWAIAPRSSSIARGQAKEARWCSPRVSIALSGAAAPVK